MREIAASQVADKYNSIPAIWDAKDKWHIRTHKMIKSFIKASVKKVPKEYQRKILNAGSAGNGYDLDECSMIHLDIAGKKISHLSNSIQGNVEKAPLKSGQIGLIVCVGSVINYCDPIRVMEEFTRLLMNGGFLIIEFENSFTFELLGKKEFNRKVVLTDTFYNGTSERLWYFSETFIKELVHEFGFEIYAEDKCHIISPLLYRFSGREKFSSYFSVVDGMLRWIPGINRFASNVIYLLRLEK